MLYALIFLLSVTAPLIRGLKRHGFHSGGSFYILLSVTAPLIRGLKRNRFPLSGFINHVALSVTAPLIRGLKQHLRVPILGTPRDKTISDRPAHQGIETIAVSTFPVFVTNLSVTAPLIRGLKPSYLLQSSLRLSVNYQ